MVKSLDLGCSQDIGADDLVHTMKLTFETMQITRSGILLPINFKLGFKSTKICFPLLNAANLFRCLTFLRNFLPITACLFQQQVYQ